MDKKESIIEIIKAWDEYEIVNAWNRRCEQCNCYDEMVEDMCSFDELFYGKKPLEIAEMIEGTDFYSGDDYFAFNGYGNIVSFSYLDDDNCPICLDEIVEYILEYGDSETNEVDTDMLVDYFLEWVESEHPDVDVEKVKHYFEEEIVEVDLLMDDWDDAIEDIINFDDVEESEDEIENNNE